MLKQMKGVLVLKRKDLGYMSLCHIQLFCFMLNNQNMLEFEVEIGLNTGQIEWVVTIWWYSSGQPWSIQCQFIFILKYIHLDGWKFNGEHTSQLYPITRSIEALGCPIFHQISPNLLDRRYVDIYGISMGNPSFQSLSMPFLGLPQSPCILQSKLKI